MQSVFETGSSALSRQDKETRPGPACSEFPVLQRVCAWQAFQRFPESGDVAHGASPLALLALNLHHARDTDHALSSHSLERAVASFPPAPSSLLSGISTADCGCHGSLSQANGLRSPGTRLESVLGPLCCQVRAAAGAGMGACCLQFSLGRRVFLWVRCGHAQLEGWPGCCFRSSLACLPFPVATWLCTPSSHLAPRVTEAASRRTEGPARVSRDRVSITETPPRLHQAAWSSAPLSS